MYSRHPLPDVAATWLTGRNFQLMRIKATKPWPDQPEFWMEVSVDGTHGSKIQFSKVRRKARGQSGYVGYAVTVNNAAATQDLDGAYNSFMMLNQRAMADFIGFKAWPPEPPAIGGRPPISAVSNKPPR